MTNFTPLGRTFFPSYVLAAMQNNVVDVSNSKSHLQDRSKHELVALLDEAASLLAAIMIQRYGSEDSAAKALRTMIDGIRRAEAAQSTDFNFVPQPPQLSPA